jgi:hypothetical protein
MQKAAALLQKGDRKLIDVARSVGYDSDAAFSKAFKRVVSVTPRDFRRRPQGCVGEGAGPGGARCFLTQTRFRPRTGNVEAHRHQPPEQPKRVCGRCSQIGMRADLDAYLQVVTSQTTALSNELNDIDICAVSSTPACASSGHSAETGTFGVAPPESGSGC